MGMILRGGNYTRRVCYDMKITDSVPLVAVDCHICVTKISHLVKIKRMHHTQQ